MDTVVVRGSGRDVAGLPLPPFDPAREPVLLDLGGAMSPDDESTDPVARATAAVASADRLATMTAAFRDEMVATAYREGAVEYAARLDHLPPAERREWGARAMLAELACALRVPETTLTRRLARTAALAAFPRFREANAAGLVSSWHCDVMLDIFGSVSDESALAAADEAMIGRALVSTPSELRVPARRWRARHLPTTMDERRRNLADRDVTLVAADDDLCLLSALLPAVEAMAIYHRLTDLAAAVQGPDEERTLGQLRADVLCDLLLDAQDPAGGGLADDEPADTVVAAAEVGHVPRCRLPNGLAGIRPTVVLTVPVLSLLGHGEEPADLEGFGPIDIETARQLAAQALSFIRVLTDPQTGAVLSVGRDRYRVPADLKTALMVRDATCRFPGCRRRAARCDLDHSTAWQDGGCTELGNLAHLCRKHHRLKHEAGWTVTHDGGGILTWTSPVGRVYRTEPATAVWPPRPALPPPRTAATPTPIEARPGGYPDQPEY